MSGTYSRIAAVVRARLADALDPPLQRGPFYEAPPPFAPPPGSPPERHEHADDIARRLGELVEAARDHGGTTGDTEWAGRIEEGAGAAVAWLCGIGERERVLRFVELLHEPPPVTAVAPPLRPWAKVPREERQRALLALVQECARRSAPLPPWRDVGDWLAATHSIEASHESIRRAFNNDPVLSEARDRLAATLADGTSFSDVADRNGRKAERPAADDVEGWKALGEAELDRLADGE